MSQRKIYVSGYFKGNLGDDLFLNILINRYPQTNFYIIAEKNKYKNWNNNLIVFDLSNRVFNKLFNWGLKINIRLDSIVENILYKICDFSIKIGGSLFMEDVIPLNNLLQEYSNKRYHILGANVGPIYSKEYEDAVSKILSDSPDVCLRDNASYNMFSKIKTIRHAPDIVFQLDTSSYNCASEKCIIISVIDLNRVNYCNNIPHSYYGFDEDTREYYHQLISTIIRHYNNDNYIVKIASFCERDGDGRYAEKLKEEYPFIQIIRYSGNIKSFINEISSAEIIYATRFHAMILGFLFKKITIPIIYSNKTLSVMNDLGYNNSFYSLLDGSAKKEFTEISAYQSIDISKCISESAGHFYELDKKLS